MSFQFQNFLSLKVFFAKDTEIFVRDNCLYQRKPSYGQRGTTLFYIVLFSWFLYIFFTNFLNVVTPLWFDWFMVLLLGGVLLYFFIMAIAYFFRRRKIRIAMLNEMQSVGLIRHSGEGFVVIQNKVGSFEKINFGQEGAEGEMLIKELKKMNPEIANLKLDREVN